MYRHTVVLMFLFMLCGCGTFEFAASKSDDSPVKVSKVFIVVSSQVRTCQINTLTNLVCEALTAKSLKLHAEYLDSLSFKNVDSIASDMRKFNPDIVLKISLLNPIRNVSVNNATSTTALVNPIHIQASAYNNNNRVFWKSVVSSDLCPNGSGSNINDNNFYNMMKNFYGCIIIDTVK